jgi:hypothetical protein
MTDDCLSISVLVMSIGKNRSVIEQMEKPTLLKVMTITLEQITPKAIYGNLQNQLGSRDIFVICLFLIATKSNLESERKPKKNSNY